MKMFCLKVLFFAVIPANENVLFLLSQQMKMFCLKVLFFAVIPANKNVLFKGFVFCCYPSK